MAKQKTRPQNNFHCFEGVGLPYWRSIAEGHAPMGTEPAQGPEGSRWEFKQDIDGYLLKNGGLVFPQQTKLNLGTYFRFFGTVAHNTRGAGGGIVGLVHRTHAVVVEAAVGERRVRETRPAAGIEQRAAGAGTDRRPRPVEHQLVSVRRR